MLGQLYRPSGKALEQARVVLELEDPHGVNTQERLAYFAGIFDGEGYVRISEGKAGKNYRKNPSFQLKIGICNTTLSLFNPLQKLFNCGFIMKRPATAKHRAIYYWECTGPNARKILESFLPYLIIKKEQALLGISFQEKVEKRDYRERPSELTRLFRQFKEQIQSLNTGKGGWKNGPR